MSVGAPVGADPSGHLELCTARAMGFERFDVEVNDKIGHIDIIRPGEHGVAIAATIPLGRPLGNHGPVRRLPGRDVVFDGVWGEPAAWAIDPVGTRFAGPPPGNTAAT